MKWYMKLMVFLWLFLQVSAAFSAGALDHFEVILWKENANVWQALDITISAVDRNGEIVSDYTGDILVFSESDAEAEFPNDLSENSYSFVIADQGSIKFENAVKFQNPGKQDIFVYDLNDDSVLGVAEIDITKEEVLKDVEVIILSPESGVTFGKNTLNISGSTTKNHQIKILINGTDEVLTTTNTDGVFEKSITDLQEGINSIQAIILDADNESIGESEVVEFKINASKPEFKSIIISPEGEVEAESDISIQVVSNTGLSSVQVLIDDIITELSEEKDGIYVTTTGAPKNPGSYPVDIILKDEFAHETNVRDAANLTVLALPELNAAGEDKEPEEEVMQIEEEDETLDLTIRNIEVVELKTKSVITWDELEAAQSYNIYKKTDDGDINLIDNVEEAKYEIEIIGEEIIYEDFAIKALGKNEETGEELQWDLSEMTKVKTGPELYVLLAFIALLLTAGIGFMRKNA